MKKEIGRFKTEKASRYIQALCKHFAHKVEVEYDAEKGVAYLPPGPAYMTATDTELTVEISGNTFIGLMKARHIIDSHLVTFAHKENYKKMDWKKK